MTMNSTDVESRSVDGELHDLDDDGMKGTFAVHAGAHLKCSSCSQEIDARDAQIVDVRRLEGSSDPTEMAAVVGLRCPRCHNLGKLVVSFGPMASAEDQDVLLALAVDEWDENAVR
jgi:hypothetical protein